MSFKGLTLSLLVSLCSYRAAAAVDSIYTDLTKDCVVVSSATDLAPIDFYEAECKSFAGYVLKIEGGDLRYGPALSFQGTGIDLQRPMNFHDVGSDKVEWVYEVNQDAEGSGTLRFIAFIYRLSIANEDPNLADRSVLYVVRLNGANSCIIGTANNNVDARALAYNQNAPCVTLP